MKKQLILSIFILATPFVIMAEKISLQRAEKFYLDNDLVRAEKEIIKAIQPPYSSAEEWTKILNYYFHIKADLYCNSESLYSNLHELTSVLTTFSKCKKVDSKNQYLTGMKVKMERIAKTLLETTQADLEQEDYDLYLTKMDYYILVADRLEKDNTSVYKKLAEVSTNANHYGRAIHYWQKMVRSGHEVEHAYNEMLSLLYGLKQYEKVDNMLVKAKNLFPKSSSIKEIEILRMIDQDLVFGAKNLAEQTVKDDPSNLDVIFLLGMLNSRLNNDEEAVESLLNVAQKDSTHFKTHLELGRHFLYNSPDEANIVLARHYLEKAEKINPTDSVLTTLLLDTYTKLNEARKIQVAATGVSN